jgi:hypothetical protein
VHAAATSGDGVTLAVALADDDCDAAVDDATADGPPAGVDADGEDAVPQAAKIKQIESDESRERPDTDDTSSRRTLAAGRHEGVARRSPMRAAR